MKKRYVLGACVVPLVIWLLVPFIVQYPRWVFSKIMDGCDKGLSEQSCATAYAMIGQSGDAFGVAASLFSGLALFAVAATLWVDYAARRSSRKPLLVSTIDETREISFDEPVHTVPRSVRFRASIKIRAANDTAMNTSVAAKISCGKFEIDLGRKYVQVPLLSEQNEVLEFGERIGEKELRLLIDEIGHSAPILLKVNARCNSLEEISWATSVTYVLSFKNGDEELIKKILHDEVVAKAAWEGGAAVSLGYQIEDDSWSHTKVVV